MNLMQRAQAWWADVFADEDGPLDGDAPASLSRRRRFAT